MSIMHVAVIGTGTMASGIVQVVARAGVSATMIGRRQESLDLSMTHSRELAAAVCVVDGSVGA